MEITTTYTVGTKTFSTKEEAEDYSIYLTKKIEVNALLSDVLPEQNKTLAYARGFQTDEIAEKFNQIWKM